MLVPVIELYSSTVSRVYVDGVFSAIVFPVVQAAEYRCIDVHTGSIYRGSTCHEAVDIYFKTCFKECMCNE